MKAMVLRAVGEPLSLEERPDLKPTAGQIRACVEACGICRTDFHVDGEHQVSSFGNVLRIDARKPPRVLFCLRTLGGFYRGRNIHF
jgi:NADPH:quinone reductase-like Zn-dependent oxidoreductase